MPDSWSSQQQSLEPVTPPSRATPTMWPLSPPPSDNGLVASRTKGHGDKWPLSTLAGISSPLTPPTTPEKIPKAHSSNIQIMSDQVSDAREAISKIHLGSPLCKDFPADCGTDVRLEMPRQPLLFQHEYECLAELGQGAWSTVYSAVESSNDVIDAAVANVLGPLPPTPPSSPPKETSSEPPEDTVLAVKIPSRRDARPLLEKEARILSLLSTQSGHAKYVVPFHGFHIPTHALVMSAIPLNLEEYIVRHKSIEVSKSKGVKSTDPILSTQTWLNVATRLISGLSFLHHSGVIHGDIKPSNILISPCGGEGDESFDLLYCDFSSSRFIPPVSTSSESVDRPAAEDEITAVTTDYTAPELLAALRTSSQHDGSSTPDAAPKAVATAAADIFALGVTLLVAATGSIPYSGVRMEIQKLGMAREGRPLDFARSCGDATQATRVSKSGLADRCLKAALDKDVTKRSELSSWAELIASELQKIS